MDNNSDCYNCHGKIFESRIVNIPVAIGNYIVNNSTDLRACISCDEWVVPANAHEKLEIKSALFVIITNPKLSSLTFKSARKCLGFTQKELSEKLSGYGFNFSMSYTENCGFVCDLLKFAMIGLLTEKYIEFENIEIKK